MAIRVVWIKMEINAQNIVFGRSIVRFYHVRLLACILVIQHSLAAATHNTNLSLHFFFTSFLLRISFKAKNNTTIYFKLISCCFSFIFFLSVKCNTAIRFKLFLSVIQTVGGSEILHRVLCWNRWNLVNFFLF